MNEYNDRRCHRMFSMFLPNPCCFALRFAVCINFMSPFFTVWVVGDQQNFLTYLLFCLESALLMETLDCGNRSGEGPRTFWSHLRTTQLTYTGSIWHIIILPFAPSVYLWYCYIDIAIRKECIVMTHNKDKTSYHRYIISVLQSHSQSFEILPEQSHLVTSISDFLQRNP